MTSYDEERALEQKYFDAAWERREQQRATLRTAPDAAAGSTAAARGVRQAVRNRLEAMPDASEAVAFGRIDIEADGETFYLGKQAILSEDKDMLVVNWQQDIVSGYYTATAADPCGIARRRAFQTTLNEIVDFDDLVFSDLVERIEALSEAEKRGVDDVLLRDLEQGRDGEMRDIVQTIHESQYDLIRRPLDTLLIVQGGPGTGKTAVALHRASWLLYAHRDELVAEDILVVGPNPTFGRYIQKVLPGLGNDGVAQSDLTRLGPIRSSGRTETMEVARLKGDGRMVGFLHRALHARVRFPERATSLRVGDGPRPLSLSRETIEAQLAIHSRLSTYNLGRAAMRDWLTSTAREWAGRTGTVEATAIDAALERVWPQLTPPAFLRDLLGSREQIRAAAGDAFTAGDIERLHRQAADRLAAEAWSDSDVALLDEANRLINGRGNTYAHIVVDEAQDLTPMQLHAVRQRSSRGSYTLVGDLAQSTGAWAHSDWDDLATALELDHPAEVVELKYGYRVPKQVTDLADRLLPNIAPGLEPATVIRFGPSDPETLLVEEDDLSDTAIDRAREYAADGHFVGIICAPSTHDDLAARLSARAVTYTDAARGELGNTINLMTAEQSKGLEFDAVVLVEPAAIAGTDITGLRQLYIALTRTTKFLALVHSEQFTWLGLEGGTSTDDASGLMGQTKVPTSPQTSVPLATAQPASAPAKGSIRERAIRMTAQLLADEVRGTLGPEAFESVVRALAEELDVPLLEGPSDQLF
jgi:DNA helicase IV